VGRAFIQLIHNDAKSLGSLVKVNVGEDETGGSQAPFQRLTDNDELRSLKHQTLMIEIKTPGELSPSHRLRRLPECDRLVTTQAERLVRTTEERSEVAPWRLDATALEVRLRNLKRVFLRSSDTPVA
jgi:hypothetical protein